MRTPTLQIIVLISICLSFAFYQKTPKKEVKDYHYRGHISVEIYLDNMLMAKIGTITIYDQYLFENAETTHSITDTKINKEGKISSEKSTEYSTLDSLLLTNTKTNTCFMFGPDSVKPVLRAKISVSQKKVGLLLKENMEELKPYIDGVTFMKDTLINGDKFKLLISDQSNNYYSKGLKKIIFYLDTDMADFPFHPISKTIDEKFGGVIFKFSYITTNDKIQDVVYNYTKGLSETDTKKVQRFVKLANPH